MQSAVVISPGLVSQSKKNMVPLSRPAFESRLNKLDLEPIIVKLMDKKEGQGWSLEFANEQVDLYKKFLLIQFLYPEHDIVPSHNIDLVWHQHVLDTEKYAKDCELLFSLWHQRLIAGLLNFCFGWLGIMVQAGLFFNHFPYFGIKSEEDAQNLNDGWEFTESKFISEFGVSVAPKSASKCARVCHWCKQKSWTERPTLASSLF